MKHFVSLLAAVGGLLILSASALPPAAAPAQTAKDVLPGYRWLWKINGQQNDSGTLVFKPDGRVERSGGQKFVWKWEATDARNFLIHVMTKPVATGVFTFDPSFTRFETAGFWGMTGIGLRQEPLSSSASGAPYSTSASGAVDRRGQLANFWTQIPNAAAWAHASLEVKVPADFATKLTQFKNGMTAESAKSSMEMKKAYTRAVLLNDMLLATANQRSQLWQQATAGGTAPPAQQALTQWASMAKNSRNLFKSPRKVLDEAVFAGGGLAKTTAMVTDSLPLVSLPPAPAEAMSPDFDANPAWIRVGGSGPAGTNFGWGDRRMKIAVSVTSNSDVPIPFSVQTYWVGWDGKIHSVAKVDERNDAASGTHPVNFEIVSIAQRNNGATFGVQQQQDFPKGVYRGWIVTIHDRQGKRIGSDCNIPEFDHLVP